ncbi:hypothetical protein CLAIMM_07428 isoform 2 [Cladophialophora immunda]|nr:hypothetical protein CLAIMM_07428 isoform 2 [Cladophialophora immunda]
MAAKANNQIDVEKLSSNLEPETAHLERPTINLGNEAVLLDVTAGHIDGSLLGDLKLAKDGHTVLIPQPSEDPNDPLNWSSFKKHMILVILGIAAGLGDFTSTLGIPPIILQGVKWNLSPAVVNYNNNLNVLMLREVPIEDQPARGQRLLRVVGIWQITVQKGYFLSIRESFYRLLRVFVKPIIIPSMIYFGINIMWAVGINIETSVLFTVPKEAGGYGFGPNALGAICLTPAIGTILAEIWGHFFNDWLANRYIKKHEGVFVPEARLVTNYVAAVIMVPGLVILGEALQHTLNYGAIIIGWGAYTAGTLAASVSLTAYLLDAYPVAAGEVNALLNFARAISGFSVGYFQVQWGAKVGYDGSFGTQAAIVGASVVIIVVLHIYGGRMRAKGGHV